MGSALTMALLQVEGTILVRVDVLHPNTHSGGGGGAEVIWLVWLHIDGDCVSTVTRHEGVFWRRENVWAETTGVLISPFIVALLLHRHE
jgi:hypothetical protein